MSTIISSTRWGRRLNPVWRLALILGFIGLASLIWWTWAGHLQSFLFVLGYPVVLLSAFLFGWAYGLIVIALSTAMVTFFFVEPLFSLRLADHRLCLLVADDGKGCPETYANGIGLTLVEALASQLNGTVTREDARPGCRIIVCFPATEPPHVWTKHA